MTVGSVWQIQLYAFLHSCGLEHDHDTSDPVDKDNWHNWPYVKELTYYYDLNKRDKL